jgi:tetratricopeptide (TPR) repeat protein
MLLVLGLPAGLGFAQDSRDTYYQQGLEALEAGHYSRAIPLLEKSVDMDPNFAPAYNALGIAHQRMKASLSDVIWFLDVALQIDPQMIDAYLNKCQFYQEAGQIDPAIKACQDALGVVPGHGKAELALAWLYLQGKDDAARAIHYFEKVLQKLQSPMIYYGLGIAYTMRGDNARVLDVIMTLRSLGEDELAAKLEQGIRPAEIPEQLQISPPIIGQRQASQLIPTPAVKPPSIKTGDSSSSVAPNSLMKIRLRGKLTGGEPADRHPNAPGSPSDGSYQ